MRESRVFFKEKKMLKKFLPALILIALSSYILIGCSGQKQDAKTATADAQETANVAGSAALKLTVANPEGWKAASANSTVMMKDLGTYSVTDESMSPGADTPDSYLAAAKSSFQTAFKNCVFGAVFSLQISGAEARRLELTGEASGLSMSYVMLYVFKDKHAYILTCGAMADSFADYKTDYEKIIASAKLE
jgi:hypothetical protein